MISLFTYTHLPIYVLSPQSILSEMAMSPADTISMCPEPELDLLSSVWVLQGSHHGGRMKASLQSCSCSPLTSLVDMLDNRRMCSGGGLGPDSCSEISFFESSFENFFGDIRSFSSNRSNKFGEFGQTSMQRAPALIIDV